MLVIRSVVHVASVFSLFGIAIPFLISRLDQFLSKLSLGSIHWAGTILFILAITGGVSCTLLLSTKGKGLPSPIDPPKRLVRKGLYGYLRNPMALSFVLTLLGEGIFFESPGIIIYSLFIFFIYDLIVIPWEERRLQGRFGKLYEQYKAEVPRWVPKKLRFWLP